MEPGVYGARTPRSVEDHTDLVYDGDGHVFIAWADDADTDGYHQIHGRGLWADGSERFTERTVNVVSAARQVQPVIVMQ